MVKPTFILARSNSAVNENNKNFYTSYISIMIIFMILIDGSSPIKMKIEISSSKSTLREQALSYLPSIDGSSNNMPIDDNQQTNQEEDQKSSLVSLPDDFTSKEKIFDRRKHIKRRHTIKKKKRPFSADRRKRVRDTSIQAVAEKKKLHRRKRSDYLDDWNATTSIPSNMQTTFYPTLSPSNVPTTIEPMTIEQNLWSNIGTDIG